MGKQARRRRRPAAVSRALGRQVLDARDDGHRPQPRAQRRVGAGPGQADRQRALRLRLLPPLHADVRQDRARRRRRRRSSEALDERQGAGRRRRPTPSSRPTTSRGLVERYKAIVAAARPAQPFPQDPHDAAAAARSRPCSARGTARRAVAYRAPGAHPRRPRHRGERADDGVRQPGRRLRHRRRLHPQPGDRRERGRTATSSSTRRARTSWPASATPSRSTRMANHFPEIHTQLLEHLRPARAALPRHVRHRVHHRAGQALHAPDPRRQAHRRGRAAHGRRDGRRGPRSTSAEAVLRVAARAARPAAAPAVRPDGRRTTVLAKGLNASPGAAVGQGVLHRRRRRVDAAEPGRAGDPRAAARRRPRTCTA